MKLIFYVLIASILLGCAKKHNKMSYGKEMADTSFDANSYIVSRIGLPDESPYTEVKKMIGVDMVTFKFYSSKVNKRQILGNIVPFNKIWKISDYSPLQMSSTSDFYIKDKEFKSGTYSIFLIPRKDSVWTLIINSETASNKFPDNYNPSENKLSIDLKPEFGNISIENLTVNFSKDSLNLADINILWDNFRIPFEIKYKNDDKIFSSISNHFQYHKNQNIPISWDEYLEAAKFSLNHNLNSSKLDTGLMWVDSSIKYKKHYSNILVRAQILAKQSKFQQALDQYYVANTLLQNDKSRDNDSGLKSIGEQISNIKNYMSKNGGN